MNKPSEKAMYEPNGYDYERPLTNITSKWRSEHITWLRNRVARGDITESYFTACVKQEIDAHTAEAITPYKKALDEAERALERAAQHLGRHHFTKEQPRATGKALRMCASWKAYYLLAELS